MNSRRLFLASCIALITSAFTFMIRQNIADSLGEQFSLTKQDVGGVMGAAFLGMAVAMLAIAPVCDWLGMGKVLLLAWLCHLTGILGTIFAPELQQLAFVRSLFQDSATNASYWILWLSTFLVGSGNGLVEIAINPLAATLFPKQKTHYLNVLHAWWPGGLIMSGLLATLIIDPLAGRWLGAAAWKFKMAIILVPLALYGVLLLGQRFPQTERVQANVTTGEMFMEALRPMFLLWAFCMLLTASTELGPNQWQESVLTRTAHVSGTLVFVYTSGLMFVMRFFAGPLAHRFSPVGMLTGSAVFSALGLYWLSFVNTPVMAFVAATVFGVGIAYFWPTMLGVTAERFPKGGALLLGLMGSFGNLAISQALPQMGAIYDSYTVANLPADVRDMDVKGPDQKAEPVVIQGEKTWLPNAVTEHIYPAGTRKLNPDARKVIEDKDIEPAKNAIVSAEAVGAAYAYRWVAVLPCILVVVFGGIAISDRLRGGYRAVEIVDETAVEGTEKEATPL